MSVCVGSGVYFSDATLLCILTAQVPDDEQFVPDFQSESCEYLICVRVGAGRVGSVRVRSGPLWSASSFLRAVCSDFTVSDPLWTALCFGGWVITIMLVIGPVSSGAPPPPFSQGLYLGLISGRWRPEFFTPEVT